MAIFSQRQTTTTRGFTSVTAAVISYFAICVVCNVHFTSSTRVIRGVENNEVIVDELEQTATLYDEAEVDRTHQQDECAQVMCAEPCPRGQYLDEDEYGCETCQCYDPCDGVQCEIGKCMWSLNKHSRPETYCGKYIEDDP